MGLVRSTEAVQGMMTRKICFNCLKNAISTENRAMTFHVVSLFCADLRFEEKHLLRLIMRLTVCVFRLGGFVACYAGKVMHGHL